MSLEITSMFDNAIQFWTGSELAMIATIVSFALCGVFVVHKLNTPPRRKKFSDWRSVKLIAILPALLMTYFAFVTEHYFELAHLGAITVLAGFACYVTHYTVKNPKEFMRFLLLPVWFVFQITIIASEFLPKKSKA